MAEKLVPGGFLGPSLFGGGGSSTSLDEPVTNAEANTLLAGEVVRISGDSAISRAQADVVAHATGLVGATPDPILSGAVGRVVSEGRGFVLLEAGLTPIAGDSLWVSATTAGRATNVTPPLQAYFGIIKDASIYAATGGVIADIAPGFIGPDSLAEAYRLETAALFGIAPRNIDDIFIDWTTETVGPFLTATTAQGLDLFYSLYSMSRADYPENPSAVRFGGIDAVLLSVRDKLLPTVPTMWRLSVKVKIAALPGNWSVYFNGDAAACVGVGRYPTLDAGANWYGTYDFGNPQGGVIPPLRVVAGAATSGYDKVDILCKNGYLQWRVNSGAFTTPVVNTVTFATLSQLYFCTIDGGGNTNKCALDVIYFAQERVVP